VQLLDKALRAAALVTCLVAGFAVLMMAAFATDSGTPMAQLTAAAILIAGGALLVGVVVACFMKRPFATAIAYGVGGIGIVLGAWQGARAWLEGATYQEVAPGTANYPALNPKAGWVIQVEGELPPSVSVEYLEATYIVGLAMSDAPGPPECRSADAHGGFPLLRTERVEVSRSAGSYRAAVTVDKFQPGPCGWHLRDVHFQIAGAGRDPTPAWISPFDQRYSLRGPVGEARSSRLDLWCRSIGWSFKKGMACETLAHIRPDLAGRVPPEERGESSEIWAYPSGGPLQVNFHDLDRLAAAAAGVPAG